MRVSLWWVVLGFISGVMFALWAQDLTLATRNGDLHIAAPRLHFLSGAPLQRLKNGVAVPFDFQMTLWAGNRTAVRDRALRRFVISYDLWEEKFSVVRQRGFLMSGGTRQGPDARSSVTNLPQEGAEAWCIDNMSVPTAGIAREQPLWVRLEIRSADPRENSPLMGESGLSLNGLVEWFSRPSRPSEPRWTVEAGPVRLSELPRSNGRGS